MKPRKATVSKLRQLARRHIGSGHSKLKTKAALWSALKKKAPRALEGLTLDKQAKPKKPKGTNRARATIGAPRPTEPLSEGFFVARVAGEREARRHHLAEDQGPAPVEAVASPSFTERLGELPDRYGDDSLELLARDPSTAFLAWDLHPGTVLRARDGLLEPSVIARVVAGDTEVRRFDLALESGSYYVRQLDPGSDFYVELSFTDREGRSRGIGPKSNRARLPRVGPSPRGEATFTRVPWETRLAAWRSEAQEGRTQRVQRGLAVDPLRWVPGSTASSAAWARPAEGGRSAWPRPLSGQR